MIMSEIKQYVEYKLLSRGFMKQRVFAVIVFTYIICDTLLPVIHSD